MKPGLTRVLSILAIIISLFAACDKTKRATNESQQQAKSVGGAGEGIGVYRASEGKFYLRNSSTPGDAESVFTFGVAKAGWLPVAGDWDGDGRGTPGLYDPSRGLWYLRATNTPGDDSSISFTFGPPGVNWVPIAGDWDGDGKDTVGLYDPSRGLFYLRPTNTPGDESSISFFFGPANQGWIPVAGDWDGDGKDTPGLYDPSRALWFLRATNTPDDDKAVSFTFGIPGPGGLLPVAGDWDGDGKDGVGLYNTANNNWLLRNSLSDGIAELNFGFGFNDARPIAGHWQKR